MPIYLKYGNDDIKGNVTAEGFKGQIEISSLQFGVGRGISTPVGNASNREASAPSISEVVVTKAMDGSSYAILQAAYEENEGKDVVISLVRTDKSALLTYAKYTLTNTLFSGYSVSSGGDKPSESISLNFTKVAFTYDVGSDTGAASDNATVTYDIAAAKTV